MCTFILLLIDIWVIYSLNWASLVAQLVKNPPATQESSVQFLGLGRSTGEGIAYQLQYSLASLVVQLGKNSLAKWETCVPFLDWEDTLEMWMATRSSILTWRIPWTIQSMNLQRIGHDLMAKPPPHDVFGDMYTYISLACCDSWGHKESDTTERLNWTELILIFTDMWLDFPDGSVVKSPPTMQETLEMCILSLDQEDSLEEGMANHSSILAWKIL